MITGLILYCTIMTKVCHVSNSTSQFDTMEDCAQYTQQFQDAVNSDPNRTFYVKDFKCVAWEDGEA